MHLKPMAPPIRCCARVPMPLLFAVVPLPSLLLPWTPAVVVPPPWFIVAMMVVVVIHVDICKKIISRVKKEEKEKDYLGSIVS